MSPPCLESQGCHFVASFYLLSLVILPSPVAHSVLSLFLLFAQSPAYFTEMSLYVFVSRDRLFCIALDFSCCFQRLGDDKLVERHLCHLY